MGDANMTLAEKYPGGSPVEWTDAEGTWQGWKLPAGVDAPHAVNLPGGGRAIRDVGIILVETEEKRLARLQREASEAKISSTTAALISDLRTLMAIKNTDKTAVQVRQQTNKNTKLLLVLWDRLEALSITVNGD